MSIHFRCRDFWHPLAILKLRHLFERSQWWPGPALLAYQEHLLRETVWQAYHEVPYYQDLFARLRLKPQDIRTVADLPKLPLLTKDVLRREFLRLQARNKAAFTPQEYQTSGTSGEPVRFLLDRPANVLEFVYYWRHWSWAGYRLGMRFAELSSSYFLGDEQRARQPYCYQPLLSRLLLNSLSLCRETVGQLAGALYRYRPHFLKGIASALFFFALCLKEKGIHDLAFRGVFSTGEMLLPPQRRLIEDVFHAKVLDSYGHMERTVAISECPAGGLHVNPEYGVLELEDKVWSPSTGLDGTAAATKVCVGRVVGTSLHNRSMPLLRYDLGDLAETIEPSSPCACGRSLPCIRRVHGRQEDVITTPDGRVITTLFIVFDYVPGIALGQVVQEDKHRLVVAIVPSHEYSPQSESELLACIRRFVGPAMSIHVERVSADGLRRANPGKFRTVISRVPYRTDPSLSSEPFKAAEAMSVRPGSPVVIPTGRRPCA